MMHFKNKTAEAFGKAAGAYDGVAVVQQETGNKLLDLLCNEAIKPEAIPEAILDIGSGTGKMTMKLAYLFPKANVIGIDIAQNMIRFASNQHKRSNLKFICADTDFMPLENNSIDLVVSNLMLQWSLSTDNTLRQWHRVIRPKGRIFFTTLGPNSLYELRDSWKKIDNYSHVNIFVDSHYLINCLTNTGFNNIQIKIINHYRFFDSLYELMLELKTLGAHNLQHKRKPGLFGKRKFELLKKYYEKYRNTNKKLCLTYEVYYVSAIK